MKNFKFIWIGIVGIALMLGSCGSEPGTTNNKYFGEFPSMEKNYVMKIEEKEKEIKECTDMEKAFELSKELELLEDERKSEIKKYVEANPMTEELPFEALDGTPYTIEKVTVNKASAGNLNIKFSLTINEDIKNKYGSTKKNLFVYYKGIDSQGKDIDGSKTVATNFSRQALTSGLKYEAFGSWQSKATVNMEDFAKVVEITKEEYENK